MTLPYVGPAMDGWPSVVVDADGLLVGDERLAWSDLDPSLCRADGDAGRPYIEMRTRSGGEARVYCPGIVEQERLQHTIALTRDGLTREDVPETGERVMLLDNDGNDTGTIGVVVGYHLGWVYLDTADEGPGGCQLRDLRRLGSPER